MLFLALLKQELSSFKRIKRNFAQNILFFLISCSLFFLISQNSTISSAQNFVNIIIFCLVFALIFANSDFLSEDFKDGTIEQMLIIFTNLELFIAAKILANWLFYALPLMIAAYFLLNFIGLSASQSQINITHFFVLLFLASLSINFLCAFCACLGLVNKSSAIISILVLPLIIPILLIALAGIFDTNLFVKSAQILSSLFVIFMVLSVFASAKIIKILSE